MPIDLNAPLAASDPEIAQQIENEVKRQHEGLEMIASENFVSRAVLEAAATVFTNKYAEGYPGKRYYGGCEYADVVEDLARTRAKRLFNADHVNVQPHSGLGQCRRLHDAAQSRRLHSRPRSGPRRPPHPRPQAELLRQTLPHRWLSGPQRHRNHRLR